jgi:hypothetical protein
MLLELRAIQPLLILILCSESQALQTFNKLITSGLAPLSKVSGLIEKPVVYASISVDGLFSNSPITSDEAIIELPTASALIATESTDKVDVVMKLAMQLLQEWKAEESSMFKAYIDNLPGVNEVFTPLHWSQDQIDGVRYPPLTNSVHSQKLKWKALYGTLHEVDTKLDVTEEVFVIYFYAFLRVYTHSK